jgi:S-adenosylmethionine hydrolase
MNAFAANGLVSLITDFGIQDHYVGVMKAVMLDRFPAVRFVDITHLVPAQNIAAGAFLLDCARPYFSTGTVHLAVIDPGVGSSRRPIAIQTGQACFVGPDNGLFSSILEKEESLVVELMNPAFRLAEISSTFHGRDIFAPAAAALASGVSISELGPVITDPVIVHDDTAGRHQILYVDHFGNCITSIPADAFTYSEGLIVAGGTRVGRVSSYSEAGQGEACALIGSHGCVEISVSGGHAASQLGLRPSDPVQLF